MGKTLMKLPMFAESINKCHQMLKPKGVDLCRILTSNDQKILNNILNSFVGIAAVQVILNSVSLKVLSWIWSMDCPVRKVFFKIRWTTQILSVGTPVEFV